MYVSLKITRISSQLTSSIYTDVTYSTRYFTQN